MTVRAGRRIASGWPMRTPAPSSRNDGEGEPLRLRDLAEQGRVVRESAPHARRHPPRIGEIRIRAGKLLADATNLGSLSADRVDARDQVVAAAPGELGPGQQGTVDSEPALGQVGRSDEASNRRPAARVIRSKHQQPRLGVHRATVSDDHRQDDAPVPDAHRAKPGPIVPYRRPAPRSRTQGTSTR